MSTTPATTHTARLDSARRAWAYLSRVAEPPCAGLRALVEAEGPIAAAQMILQRKEPAELTALVDARRGVDCSAADLDLLDRRGGRLLTPDDEEWPHLAFGAFDALRGEPGCEADAPLVLWVLGPARVDDVAQRAAAIVGTRASTAYGDMLAGDFAAGLVDAGMAVVSGAAYGIEGAAHRSAMARDGVTVAVLATGLDVPYPSGHSALLHRISQTGALVTEYPPGVRPARPRLLLRNLLVAALSRSTVVIEAGVRSGATYTASCARMLGRPVCAVPGPVSSAASAGCHEMLRAGEAELVTRAEHVVELAGHVVSSINDKGEKVLR